MINALSEITAHAVTVWISLAPFLLIGAFIAGVLHVTLPPNLIKRALRGRGGVARAVLVGVPLPLCSCGVIPAGLGLRQSGASRGATVGFLVSTPQTGVDSILVSASMLGAPFALYKVLAAALTGLIGGGVTELISAPDETAKDETAKDETAHDETTGDHGELRSRAGESRAETESAPDQASRAPKNDPRRVISTLINALRHGESILDSIWGWLVFGVISSALISYALPLFTTGNLSSAEQLSASALFGGVFGGGSLVLSYALTLALSTPLYICATASVPIAATLVERGFPIGAALIFLMAGPATNVATIGAVYRGLGRRALVVYLTTIIGGAVAFALLLDLGLGWEAPRHLMGAHEHTHAWWEVALSALLGVWLITRMGQSVWERGTQLKLLALSGALSGARSSARVTDELTHELSVSGITCQGCVRKLNRALMSRGDVSVCEVSDTLDHVSVKGSLTQPELIEVIESTGFSAHPAQRSTPPSVASC